MVAYKTTSIAEDTFYRKVGDRLRKIRVEAGLPQLELATALGIPQRAISAYENGERVISTRTLFALLYELDCPDSELIQLFDIFSEEKLNEKG